MKNMLFLVLNLQITNLQNDSLPKKLDKRPRRLHWAPRFSSCITLTSWYKVHIDMEKKFYSNLKLIFWKKKKKKNLNGAVAFS